MNIHPIAVHFPIAFLVFYSLLEVVSGTSMCKNCTWLKPVKIFLLISGSILAMMTLSTGEAAEHMFTGDRSVRDLIEMHAFFANLSTYIFSFIGAMYLIQILQQWSWYEKVPRIIKKIFLLYVHIINRRWLIVSGAIIGLLAITITGGLGGAIVYGPDVDPFVRVIYHIFF